MYSGNFDLLSTCRDLSSPVFFKRRNQKQVVIGGIAVVFELMGIILAGFSYVLLCSIAYLPGFCFYWIACRETKHQITGKEKVMIGLICVAALLSIGLLAVGWIKI